MTTTHDLTAAAAAVGRYQSLNVILEHLFTDDERADVVRAMVRRHLPDVPIPDPVPEPDRAPTGQRMHAWTCDRPPSHPAPWSVLRLAAQLGPVIPAGAEPFAACETPEGPVVYWRYQA